ncbi:MAG: tetratricopeptide repeat protein, partial [Planctomycetota bacterium]
DGLYAQLGRAQDRVALWERAEKVAGLPRARVAAGLGRALLAAGRARDAEPHVFKAVVLERTGAQDVLDALAQATQRSGLPATLELFERARRASVPAAMVENGIGKAYLAANRLLEAEPYLLRAQALDSQSRGYVVDVCELFLKQGRREDAVRNLRALLDIDPQNARAKALLAQAAGGGR